MPVTLPSNITIVGSCRTVVGATNMLFGSPITTSAGGEGYLHDTVGGFSYGINNNMVITKSEKVYMNILAIGN